MAIPFILYFNDLAIIFSFYLITFNLVEVGKEIMKGKKPSKFVFTSLLFFEASVILQLLDIIIINQYINYIPIALFLVGTALFIIPGLRVAYEKEKI